MVRVYSTAKPNRFLSSQATVAEDSRSGAGDGVVEVEARNERDASVSASEGIGRVDVSVTGRTEVRGVGLAGDGGRMSLFFPLGFRRTWEEN